MQNKDIDISISALNDKYGTPVGPTHNFNTPQDLTTVATIYNLLTSMYYPRTPSCIFSIAPELTYTAKRFDDALGSLQPCHSKTGRLHIKVRIGNMKCCNPTSAIQTCDQTTKLQSCIKNIRAGNCCDEYMRNALGKFLFPHKYNNQH